LAPAIYRPMAAADNLLAMLQSLRDTLQARFRSALEVTPFSGRRIQARRARRARRGHALPGAFVIALPDLTGRGLRPVYLERRGRYATVTSVKLLDPETLVCASFLEKKLYLLRFDPGRRTSRILDEIATTHRGIPVETDLLDADPAGETIVVSNFHHGAFTQFCREGDRLAFVRDLDFGLDDSKVHGVKFLDSGVLAGTIGSRPTGVRFFDLQRAKPTVHIDLPLKTQDVSFLSDREMIVLAVQGAPTRKRQTPYASELVRVRFDLATGEFEIGARRVFEDTHFDASVIHQGRLWLTDQRNDCVKLVDPESLDEIGRIDGYDFPHGIDVGFGLLAVTNYGANTIDLRRIEDLVALGGQWRS
jgi:hypothetical protein